MRVEVTANAFWSRGGEPPAVLGVEILAQCAALLLPSSGAAAGDAGMRPGYLAGIENFQILAKAQPGDVLTAHAEVERRFGPLMRVKVELGRAGQAIATGVLLLSSGDF